MDRSTFNLRLAVKQQLRHRFGAFADEPLPPDFMVQLLHLEHALADGGYSSGGGAGTRH